jgi:hypothetical protein
MMATVRVKFLRGTSLGNGTDANPGEVKDIDARLLPAYLQQGRVVEVEEIAAPAAAPDPVPEKPVRKGKKNA